MPVAIDLLRAGGTFLEVGNFSDLGEVAISPHRHLCSKGIRLIGIPGQEHGAYGPGMRQLARYRKLYPLDEFVVHRYPLEEAKAAVEKSIQPDSLKVVIEPWSTRRDENEVAYVHSQTEVPRTESRWRAPQPASGPLRHGLCPAGIMNTPHDVAQQLPRQRPAVWPREMMWPSLRAFPRPRCPM